MPAGKAFDVALLVAANYCKFCGAHMTHGHHPASATPSPSRS